jgi:hypothetical protein
VKASTLPLLTEAEFTRQVLALARLRGWRSAHFRPGRTVRGWSTAVQGDGKGFPDLVLIHTGMRRLIVCELKVGNGRASPGQRAWLRDFAACGIPAYLWYPRDWTQIEAVLSGSAQDERHGKPAAPDSPEVTGEGPDAAATRFCTLGGRPGRAGQ